MVNLGYFYCEKHNEAYYWLVPVMRAQEGVMRVRQWNKHMTERVYLYSVN